MKKTLLITILILSTLVVNKEKVVINTNIINKENELSINNIIKYMQINELAHIDILLAQIHLETGNLKKIKHKNNLFGFRDKKYLTFDSWEKCIDYKKKWQDKHWENYLINKGDDYYGFLHQKNYAQDNEYINKIKEITKIYKYARE